MKSKLKIPIKFIKNKIRSDLGQDNISTNSTLNVNFSAIRVVYDTLPKKQEIRSITTSIKPSAMPSKSIISSARLNLEKNTMKRVTSRSFPPKSMSPYNLINKNVA